MDLRQLEMLVAIAEHGSFSAAARALHTVQSNVSTHIARLERELGATCIDRSTGQLTEEGQIVFDRARRLQSELEALVADVTSFRAEISGRVTFGIIGTIARWVVPPLLVSMERHHPKVQILVLDATTTSLIPQLVGGTLDLALVNLPIDDPDVVFEPIFEEELVFVAPHGHPFYDREQLELSDLHDEPILVPNRGTSFRDDLDAACAAQNVTLTPRAEIDGMRLLASLTFDGFCAGVVPATATSWSPDRDWRRIPIDGGVRRVVGVARRRRGLLSAPARALGDTLTEVISAQAPGHAGLHLV